MSVYLTQSPRSRFNSSCVTNSPPPDLIERRLDVGNRLRAQGGLGGVLALVHQPADYGSVWFSGVAAQAVQPVPVGSGDLDRGHPPLVRSLVFQPLRAQAQADSVPLPRLECGETRPPLLDRILSPPVCQTGAAPPPHSGKIAYWMYQIYYTTGIQK